MGLFYFDEQPSYMHNFYLDLEISISSKPDLDSQHADLTDGTAKSMVFVHALHGVCSL